jgi:ribonuclease P protein component
LEKTARLETNEAPAFGRLTRRAEFQRAARGRRAQTQAFTLQANARAEPLRFAGPRIGLTVTKKVGNAVVRNRIRRRLREALRRASALEALPDHDYVLIVREAALTLKFETLVGVIDVAFQRLHRGKSRFGPRDSGKDGRS